MRRKIVAGNWKMNLSWDEAKSLLLGINNFVNRHKPESKVIVCPPFPFLDRANDIFIGHASVGAQNISEFENGAYTGEISGSILNSIGVHYTIVGHSERRKYFHETNEQIGEKVAMAIKKGIKTIVCCGETGEERESGNQNNVVKEQLDVALKNISPEDMVRQIIAYEPVWAIGTGQTASPSQAQEMHAFIRNEVLEPLFGADVANEVRILYGGSVNSGNADDLFSQPDIDGGLIGGASLKLDDFTSIIHAAERN
ncbi:triose-phosphate isomerase [Weeksellaceae bacterium KMM 9713]|uniref:Triosephosphate isomerase n=1 Tax=Profundicola chukchiensis TaxID=2961959 RepID=A0A9X4RX96_9FLAO|nr:triose-phosphate isomerase [Profundicola chukchiensis]MDG4945914.1 triose-phosphate isomerase [Profundicola chukchiensis]MDG4951228.1 triose-phosphate isomerase [Profundicola chukchiensis]